jgi:hypothetical protein
VDETVKPHIDAMGIPISVGMMELEDIECLKSSRVLHAQLFREREAEDVRGEDPKDPHD